MLQSFPAGFIVIRGVDILASNANKSWCPVLNLHVPAPQATSDSTCWHCQPGHTIWQALLTALLCRMQVIQTAEALQSISCNACRDTAAWLQSHSEPSCFDAKACSAALSTELRGVGLHVCMHLLRYSAEHDIFLQHSAVFTLPLPSVEGFTIESLVCMLLFCCTLQCCLEDSLAWVPFILMGHSAQGSGYWKDLKK